MVCAKWADSLVYQLKKIYIPRPLILINYAIGGEFRIYIHLRSGNSVRIAAYFSGQVSSLVKLRCVRLGQKTQARSCQGQIYCMNNYVWLCDNTG